jgi:hypothetical protein
MLNLYQNNTAMRNQTAIRDMFNLDAYYELCKIKFSITITNRRGAKLRDAEIYAQTGELI